MNIGFEWKLLFRPSRDEFDCNVYKDRRMDIENVICVILATNIMCLEDLNLRNQWLQGFLF